MPSGSTRRARARLLAPGLLAALLAGCSVLYQSELPPGCDVEDGDMDGALSIECGGGDCDDEDSAIHPGAEELCNGLDDDCDGRFDEGLRVEDWYQDCDEDGLGDAFAPTASDCRAPSEPPLCDTPTRGTWVTRGGDCDDTNPRRTVACGSCAEVDFLIVMDTSGSMAAEQDRLAGQLGRIVAVLKSGDVDGDGVPEAEPITDLHVGVVTPDLGSGPFEVPGCPAGNGEDGILRSRSGSVDPPCPDLHLSPPFLSFTPEDGTEAISRFERDWSCLVRAGTDGCGFEQPLEAALKAVTPASSPVRFFEDSLGQADGPNRGFLRPDSLLVLLFVTDEDDCSTSDRELFNVGSDRYPGELSLRCHQYPGALRPVSRYVSGLLAEREADDLIYGMVVGVPPDLVPADGSFPDYAAILADPRMDASFDPTVPGGVRPSCSIPGRGSAVPPRRLVELAQGLEERGAVTMLSSICETGAYDLVAGAILQAAVEDSMRRCGGTFSPAP